MNEDQKVLLAEWLRRVVLSSQGHYENAQRLDKFNLFLGIPVVCLSAFVGTSVFASLGKNVESNIRIIIGLISVAAAVLASLQTFLGFSEKAERHKVYGAHYGSLRRKIEVAFTDNTMSEDDLGP
jgi:hypothetical protein